MKIKHALHYKEEITFILKACLQCCCFFNLIFEPVFLLMQTATSYIFNDLSILSDPKGTWQMVRQGLALYPLLE